MTNGQGQRPDNPTERSGPRYSPLVIVLAAVAAGIILDRHSALPIRIWFSAGVISLAAWLAAFRCGWQKTAGMAVLLAAACIAGGWHHFRWSLYDVNNIGFFVASESQGGGDGPVCLRAEVLETPSIISAPPYDPMRIIPRSDRTRLELCVEELRDGDAWRPAGGRATLYVAGHVLGIKTGDRVEVLASLYRPSKPRNPGGRDYATHLRADGRLAMLRGARPECVSLIEQTTASAASAVSFHARVRAAAGQMLCRYLDERTRGVATALLLGSRDQVDDEQYEAFAETGTIHLLAVSGLHVGIVAGMVFAVVRLLRMPRRRGLLLVAVAIVAYAFLTGGRPPVVRATVLVIVLCLSYAWARRPSPYNSLAAAALVVLALNPAELFNLGAQLSFLAVAAIMSFAAFIVRPHSQEEIMDRVLAESEPFYKKSIRWLLTSYRQGVLISLAIWFVAAPLIMARFNILSPASIILTPILVPLVAVALYSGLLVLVCGWLLPPMAAAAGWCCDGSLLAIQWIVMAGNRVPYGHIWMAGPDDWWLAGFYLLLAAAVIVPSRRHKQRYCAALLAGWFAVWPAVSYFTQQEGRLVCTFLSVGHGCAAVLELPDGRTMLYDVGQFSSPDACTQTVAECLWSRGISRLDAVVISHADADHYNGLPGLLEKIPIAAVYVSPMMFDSPSASLRALRMRIEEAGVAIHTLQAGERLDDEMSSLDQNKANTYTIEVLHPCASCSQGSKKIPTKTVKRNNAKIHDNSQSIVLLIECQGRKILLPGDIEPPGLDAFLAREPVDCDVLLAPHHGSANSNPPGLVVWCKPEIVVISGSPARNRVQSENAYKSASGLPQPVNVLHTGRVGAVRVEICDGAVRASGFLENNHPDNESKTGER